MRGGNRGVRLVRGARYKVGVNACGLGCDGKKNATVTVFNTYVALGGDSDMGAVSYSAIECQKM